MQPQLKNNVSLITVRVWQDGVENIRRIHPQNFLKKTSEVLETKVSSGFCLYVFAPTQFGKSEFVKIFIKMADLGLLQRPRWSAL